MPVTETFRDRWSDPRSTSAADDTLVSAAIDTMKNANIPATAYSPAPRQNALEVSFAMDADGSNCVAYLFAARKEGDIVLIWTGTLTAGTQEATDGGVWVDTVAGSTDNWITTIKEVDGGGNNRMFRIVMDTCGYHKFFTQYTGLSSETVKTFYSGF
jgi:hypothetical protein